jgi:uncharacterized delta-60 repeat protein
MKTWYALLLLLMPAHFLLAQPGALDVSFDPGSGLDGNGSNTHIEKIRLQPDGKILVGGTFTSCNGHPALNLVRLTPNGGIDSSFHSPISCSSWVRDIEIQADGKILVAGDFDNYDSLPIGRIVRLHSNGDIDTSFRAGMYFDQPIYSIALQNDGKIVCGGLFTEYDGTTCNRLARLHSNGCLDTTFNTQTGANGTVEEVLIQPNGKIIIAGDFTYYWGDPCIRISRVNTDGTRDSSFNALPGSSAVIFATALQPNGSILVGGNFNQYDFQPRSKLARVLDIGGVDPQFYVGSGANSRVEDILLLPDGRVLFAGGFTQFKDANANRIALTDSLCYIDTTFNINGSGANDGIGAFGLQPNGKLLIGGYFTSYNGTPRSHIARLYNCLTPQPDSIYGTAYALCSGTPQTYSIAPISGVTRYEWTLPSGWSGSSDSTSITAISDGNGGTITVKAFTDSCGWSYTTTRAIATIQPPGVNICLVTVDSASTHNIILWEKPTTTLIDSFCIYRETTSNVYTKIASVPYSALSEYHDTTANPNATSYRYKLSVLDTCGAESARSPFHRTIHLQNLGNGAFQWTFYQIEGQTNPVLSFNVYRDNLGNGNYFPIGNVPGTNATFTDVTFNAFSNSEYVLDVDWSISCNPTRQVNTTRSNIRKKTTIDFPLTIDEPGESNIHLNVYPNPATDMLHLQFSDGTRPAAAYLVNALGERVAALQPATHTLDVSSLAAGIYLLYAESPAGIYKARVCIY